MELRGCRNFHFINAFKGGSVKKVPNVHHSRPTLKFRSVEDIYGDNKSSESLPAFRPRFVSDGLKVDGQMNTNEIPCLTNENTNEVLDLVFNGSVSEGDSDLEDMTLRHLKEMCKSRKRKRLISGSSKESAVICSLAKPDHHNLRPEDNECDLEVPLSALKCKLSKRKKKKRHDVSELSQITRFIVKSEINDSTQNFFQASQDTFAPLVVKAEVFEPEESHFQSMPCVPKDLFALCNEPIGSSRAVPFEIPETTNAVKSPVSVSPTNDAECVMVTMANDQHKNYVDPESLPDVCLSPPDVWLSGWEMEKVDNPKLSLILSSPTKDPDYCVVNMAPYLNTDYVPDSVLCAGVSGWDIHCNYSRVSSPPLKQPNYCVANMAPFENNEYVSDSAFDAVVSGLEIVKVKSPDTTSFHLSESSLLEFEEERSIIHTVPYSIPPEKNTCVKDCKDDSHKMLRSQSSAEVPSLQTNCNNHIQVPDFTLMDGACSTDDNTKDYLSYSLEGDCSTHFESQGSAENSQSYPSTTSSVFPNGNAVSGDDNSPFVCSDSPDDDSTSNNNSKDDLCFKPEAYRSTHFETHGSPGNCQSETTTSSSVSPPVGSVSGDDVSLSDCPASPDDGSPTKQSPKPEYVDELSDLVRIVRYHTENPQPTPEKLLSKRKAMSPAAQEKLCNAMKSAKLHDHELTTCKEKYISKLSNHRILRAEGLAQIRRAEVIANAKQTNLRPKYDKQATNQKNITKVPPLTRAVPRFGTGCTSILECSRSAMAFSQRQMSDIDCIASKLTKELRYMKDLMKESLLPEACPSASKQNVLEVRTAIDNATRLEETTKKWIASMTRDSNRFCKIMQMTQDGAEVSEKVTPKARKISFADEAGGKLCHVKVFEDDTL